MSKKETNGKKAFKIYDECVDRESPEPQPLSWTQWTFTLRSVEDLNPDLSKTVSGCWLTARLGDAYY